MLDIVDRNQLFFEGSDVKIGRHPQGAELHTATLPVNHGVGHNKPPSPIEIAKENTTALSGWMAGVPVITSEEDAKAAKLLVDRGNVSLQEMEKERDSRVRPLNEQVAAINDTYRPVRTALSKVMDEIKRRLTNFAKAKEAEAERKAEEARQIAAEAERIAREKELTEREGLEGAALGELDVDVGTLTAQADEAFAALVKADRTAQRADRETHVKITGGFGKALGLRTHEVLTVSDWKAAIEDIGLTEGIKDAILTAARAYRKINEELPDGITATQERSI